MLRKLAPLVAVAVCVAFACKRVEDEAAKQRIFSPEEPIGAAAEAKEPIDARRLDDPAVAQRVLEMPRGEIAQRLGSYRAQTRVQFAWFRGPGLTDGGTEASLSEETTVDQAKNGDFELKLTNDHNQGFEMVWAKGEVFVKGLFGPYRKRRTDRTDVARVREQTVAALPTFDRLARGLKLRPTGEAVVDGRKVVKYAVEGFGARAAQKETPDLPEIEYPSSGGKTSGPDPDTARRLELWEKEEPTRVSGTVVVDAETAAPIACDLKGHFRVLAQGQAGPAAELDLHAALVTTAIGKDRKISSPPWEPDSLPHAVKDPLRFLRKGEPGTAPAAPSEAEGEDDETGNDEPAPAKPSAAPAKKKTE